MPLSKEQEERYTPLIDEILAASDLTTISTKKVRVALQEKTGDDFSDELKVSC
jgi:upstream activation factor subunit UAF30